MAYNHLEDIYQYNYFNKDSIQSLSMRVLEEPGMHEYILNQHGIEIPRKGKLKHYIRLETQRTMLWIGLETLEESTFNGEYYESPYGESVFEKTYFDSINYDVFLEQLKDVVSWFEDFGITISGLKWFRNYRDGLFEGPVDDLINDKTFGFCMVCNDQYKTNYPSEQRICNRCLRKTGMTNCIVCDSKIVDKAWHDPWVYDLSTTRMCTRHLNECIKKMSGKYKEDQEPTEEHVDQYLKFKLRKISERISKGVAPGFCEYDRCHRYAFLTVGNKNLCAFHGKGEQC